MGEMVGRVGCMVGRRERGLVVRVEIKDGDRVDRVVDRDGIVGVVGRGGVVGVVVDGERVVGRDVVVDEVVV